MHVFRWTQRRTPDLSAGWVSLAQLQLQGADGAYRQVTAQIDSGASISIMRNAVAGLLGIRVAAGRPIALTGIRGGGLTAFVHDCAVRLEWDEPVMIPIAFSDHDDHANLLGRVGFFANFEVVFDPARRHTRIARGR